MTDDEVEYYEEILDTVDPHGDHITLLEILAGEPFRSRNLGDRNRSDDVLYFREEKGVQIFEPPSVLEVLYVFAFRLYEADDGSDPLWYFWSMLRNAGLKKYDEEAFGNPLAVREVRRRVHEIAAMQYGADGSGGYFRITREHYIDDVLITDMRKIPLWDQAMAWLDD